MVCEEKNNIDVWQIGLEDINQFSRFVVEVYRDMGWESRYSDFVKIYREDLQYGPHCIMMAIKHREKKQVLAVNRLSLKNEMIIFPFESFFGIDLKKFCTDRNLEPNEIWHGGRVAVNKTKLMQFGFEKRQAFELLKIMFRLGYKIISKYENNLFLGESHIKVKRLYNMMGFDVQTTHTKKYSENLTFCASYIEVSKIKKFAWLIA